MIKRCAGHMLIFSLLTLFTQIGGIIYLCCIPLFGYIGRKIRKRWPATIIKLSGFCCIYLIISLLIVPLLAKPFGRVPLPAIEKGGLRPLNILTCIFNRHYVTPQLYKTVTGVAAKMKQAYPLGTVNYLDGCFPFFNGYPLLPHRSHNDGKKLDLAFYYTKNGKQTDKAPSFMGYGIFEEPLPGEINAPERCKEKGYWQYDALKYVVPQWNKNKYRFDLERTKVLVGLLIQDKAVSRIFIEPHLKQRMNIGSNKIGYHGCKAVRHDDHIHFQIQ